MTNYENKLVQSKFFSLELTIFGAKGGRVTMGLWRAQVKPPTVKKSRPEGLVFDVVGNNLRCANQVEEVVREEQLDRGRCQALLWIQVSTPAKEQKDSSLTRGHSEVIIKEEIVSAKFFTLT